VIPVRVGIVGASGYTGVELLRLCAGHPDFEIGLATADTSAGARAADVYPSLAATYPDLRFQDYEAAATDGLDLVFLALPHGASQAIVPDLRKRVPHVVDLAADFRLRDAALYPEWYGEAHCCPDLLAEFAFGIPELFRDALRGAPLIAAAGCYVTAAALVLAPLVRGGVIQPDGVIVDAASGVSGAGRALLPTTSFGTVNEDFVAYSLLHHRHTPEIEQATGATVLFTPHLAPMTRGILATCYARPASASASASVSASAALDSAAVVGVLQDAYRDEPFVVVTEEPPSTKATLGSNCAHVTARVDPRTGWVLALGALDNLTKGASGQAVQCANLALGLPETAGLPRAGLYP
jgi:N-acetyl-gamma-glutamyl-phosphate reductase